MKTPLLALACIGLPLLCPAARADAIFQEDFETTASGASPSGWQSTPTTATALKAAPDPLNVDEQALTTPGGDSRSTGAYYTMPSAATTPLGFKFSFDLYTAEGGDNNWSARWYLLNGTTASYNWFTPGYGVYLGPTTVRLHKTSGGGSSGSPGSAAVLAQVTVPAAAYTTVYGWTRVELEWFADGTLHLSLNGKRVLSHVDPSPLSLSVRTISNLSFLNNNAAAPSPDFSGARLRYDNVRVSPIHHRSAFTGLTNGAPPPGWYSSAGVATAHKVATDPLAGANLVLAAPGGTTRTTGAYQTLPAAMTADEGLRLAFDLHIDNAGDDNWNTRWYLESGATDHHERFTPGYGLYIGRNTVRIQKTSGGGTAASPGATTTLVTQGISPGLYDADGWTRVEFEWRADGTLRLFLNGAFAASVVDPSPLAPSFRTLSTTSFLNNNASSGPLFTGAVLRYDNLSVSELSPLRDDVFLLVWAATDPASSQSTDTVLRDHARAATGALATKLAAKPAELGEITILLECIFQWWLTGAATATELDNWLAAARDSMELRYAAVGGATDASWETVVFVLEFLTEMIDGSGAGATHPILPSPTVVPSRFAAVPAAGVHPRVLVSASEMPAVRTRLAGTAAGVKARTNITGFLNSAIGTSGSSMPLRAAYDKLLAGDLTAMNGVHADWVDQMGYVICYQAFLALIDLDATRGAEAATTLTTYAQISQARVLDANAPLDEFVGFAYDFAYGYMSTAQRNTVRGIIATATSGELSSGSNLPASHRNDNLVPHGMILPLLALSIEGETGYDSTIYPRSVQLMEDFLEHGIDAQGAPREDMHYLNYGMSKGALALVAMAKRGDNLFTGANYRRLHNWLAQAMEPFGNAFSTHDDTPTADGGLLPNYAVMKWVWPTDPILDFVWKNRVRPNYTGVTFRADFLSMALFPSDWSGGDPDPVVGGPALGLALSWLGEKRRLFIARDKWSADALAVHVECNPFLKGPGHQHANSGDFTLSALGRRWAVDHGYHVSDSSQHSIVQVDGAGQGYFAAPSRLVEAFDDGDVAYSAVDSRYPYAWRYEFESRIGSPALPWMPELLMGVREYYQEAATSAYLDAPWSSPSINYPYKRPHNPLEKAFRTVLLRRAAHPYALVIDDIKKSSASAGFVWLMQIASDLEIKQNTGGQLVLGPVGTTDNRRLLVRMLAPGSGSWALETFTDEDKTFKRVKFTLNAVEPAFKVLLYPHHNGDPLPTTALGTSPAELQVTWSGQADTFDVDLAAGGRTVLQLQP